MREILFRGKRLDNGEWETGSLVLVRMGCHDQQTFIADKMTGFHTPVDPATVGQYTGLNDKNGKKIWEGDIVRITPQGVHLFEMVGPVEYIESDGQFCLVTEEEMQEAFYYEPSELEVLGNIHDDPELLGGSN